MDMEVPLSTLSAPLRMKFRKSEWLLESNASKPQHFRFYKQIGKMQPAQPELRPKVLSDTVVSAYFGCKAGCM